LNPLPSPDFLAFPVKSFSHLPIICLKKGRQEANKKGRRTKAFSDPLKKFMFD
jgi:hypothetical protein